MENKIKAAALLLIIMMCPVLAIHAQQNIEDMDEDDWLNQRDTTMLTRKNRTIGRETKYDAMKYIVKDTYSPDNESFTKSWYDHVYVGASAGIGSFLKERNVNTFSPLALGNIFIGKDLTPEHSVRLSLAGAFGYSKDNNSKDDNSKDNNSKYYNLNVKGDYFYNLTNRFSGYSTTHPLEISFMGGVGFGICEKKDSDWTNHGYFEAHVGMQFKVYTGPFGSIAVEPYVGYASDAIDFSTNHWRGFDWQYGITVGYMFYTQDNLSRQSRMRLLQHRLKDDRLIDRMSLESWRTPWFFQVAMGGIKSSGLKVGEASETFGVLPGSGKGNVTSLVVGRWMSPVIGMRAGIGTRTTNWLEGWPVDLTPYYSSEFAYGKVEWLLNPMGFLPDFTWDAPFGGYLFAGVEAGQMRKYLPGETKSSSLAGGITGGVNLWYQLSKDLRVFVEPNISYDYYNMKYNNYSGRSHDLNYGIDIGLAMMIRSQRYRDPAEFDDVQNYNYRDIQGFSFGIAGGGSILQRAQANYGHSGFNYSGMIYGEYRFNELHGVRVAGDIMHLNANIAYNNAIDNIHSNLFAASVNYQLNVTNLCSGRFSKRMFNLEAFIGPAYATVIEGIKGNRNSFYGFDFGLKLSYPIMEGISAVLQPTFYALSDCEIPAANPIGLGTFQLYQDITVGLQFDTNHLISGIKKTVHKIKNQIKENREYKLEEEKMHEADRERDKEFYLKKAQFNKEFNVK